MCVKSRRRLACAARTNLKRGFNACASIVVQDKSLRTCSPHRLIRDNTFRLKRMFATKKTNKTLKVDPWLACADCTRLYETTLYAHALIPLFTRPAHIFNILIVELFCLWSSCRINSSITTNRQINIHHRNYYLKHL